MKRLLFVLLLLTVFFTLCVPAVGVFADDGLSDVIEELLQELDVAALEEYLASLKGEEIDVKTLIGEYITGDFRVDYGSFADYVLSVFCKGVREYLPTLAVLTAISVLSGILHSVKGGFAADGMTSVIHFVCLSSVVAILLTHVVGIVHSCAETVASLQRGMQLIFPILITLIASSGGSASVAIFQPAVLFLSEGIVSLFSTVVLPISVVITVLGIINSFGTGIRLTGMAELLKSLNRWIIGLTVAVFSVFLSVQGISSSVYDGVSIKALKYAIGTSVPIVGGFVSGGFDLVIAGCILIKNAVGIGGVLLVAAQIFAPIVQIVPFCFVLKAAAAICEPLGDGKMVGFYREISANLGQFTAVLACVGLLFFITVLLLVFSTGSFLP